MENVSIISNCTLLQQSTNDKPKGNAKTDFFKSFFPEIAITRYGYEQTNIKLKILKLIKNHATKLKKNLNYTD